MGELPLHGRAMVVEPNTPNPPRPVTFTVDFRDADTLAFDRSVRSARDVWPPEPFELEIRELFHLHLKCFRQSLRGRGRCSRARHTITCVSNFVYGAFHDALSSKMCPAGMIFVRCATA